MHAELATAAEMLNRHGARPLRAEMPLFIARRLLYRLPPTAISIRRYDAMRRRHRPHIRSPASMWLDAMPRLMPRHAAGFYHFTCFLLFPAATATTPDAESILTIDADAR